MEEEEIGGEIEEGFVVRFESGLRLKVKCADYVRLHRLLTGVSKRTIWDLLRNGQSVERELLDHVPDEFFTWVAGINNTLMSQYYMIETEAQNVYHEAKYLPTRKEQAEYILKSTPYAAVVFKMLDGKPYNDVVWKLLRPTAERPFKEDIDG